MSQQTDLLEHDADLILSLFDNPQAQKQRLLAIESKLRSGGVDVQRLHRQIDRLASAPDAGQYRCSYHLYHTDQRAAIDAARWYV